MKEKTSYEKLFHEDEMRFCVPEPGIDAKTLLKSKGVYYLKNLEEPLNLDTALVIRKVHKIRKTGKAAYKEIGVGKIWGHWIVRMTVFSKFYRTHSLQKLDKVDDSWDGNTLLGQKGIFLLIHVCRHIPLTYRQLRYRALKEPRSKEIYGIWRHSESGKFVVDMEVFSRWVKDIWM